ncbi:glycosyltransferase [Parvularcula bermudensis HTCC2503]|uniref:Glycosyltransferase n=1 Tax=Parvularcula bermudensis (strain ATCC BAA-594 / HTCC2503 / KCTC 12087) TaxID=314260 RepID=E0TI26_PARBH|nr:glycosyltransferase [Parvularcula bermudensis]ADM09365.1 glycosyltransferase [Parvularcula bermudensis HTCC2503]
MSRSELPVIACVTAYNEESTIGAVISALKACPLVDRVQVVDDGSEDATAAIAEALGARTLRLPRRVPVGEAIMHHLDDEEGEVILLWCDADLVGLRPDHVGTLIDRFRMGQMMQVTSSRGVPPTWPGWARNRVIKALWAWLFGPISGERAILKSDFCAAKALAASLQWSEMMRGYGIVLFLNWYASRFGGGSVTCYFDDLTQRQKYQKWKTDHPVRQMVAQWGQFAAVWGKIRLNRGRIEALAVEQAPLPSSRF